jgi:drug/metabolite transporter (DMT)-like permease
MRFPSPPRTRRWGLGLATLTAIISGFAVFINSYGVTAWKGSGASTATYTTIKNLFAAAVLVGIVSVATGSHSRERFTRPHRWGQWAGLALVGIVGGSIPFLLFFEGLSRASSPQAGFIHKTLVIWVVLLAVPLLRERVGLAHLAAIGMLVWGQAVLIGGIDAVRMGSGEVMILGATLMWAVEVVIAKQLLSELSPLTVGVSRMGIGVAILIGYAVASGATTQLASVGLTQWGWALATGAILSVYVASWYSALSRAPAVDVTAVLVFGAVITAFLRSGVDGIALPSTAGLVLVSLGAATVLVAARRRSGLTQ